MKSRTIFLLLFIGLACKENPPGPHPYAPSIILSAEAIGVTEAWLRVRFTDPSLSHSVTLKRDSQIVLALQTTSLDTIVLTDSLLPQHNYSYRAYSTVNNLLVDSSIAVQITTVDTTSHNFTWQIDTLGDGNASTLYDVAIINDTLAFAIGGIYLKDSTGQINPEPYNLMIWNGQTWTARKLNYGSYPPVIRSIFAINDHDVWLDPWFHWNGQDFQERPIDPLLVGVQVNKMWGDSNGIYVGGYSGFVALRKSDGTWQTLESGTTLPIQDIWGGIDPATGEEQVLCVASNTGQNQGKKLLRIRGNTVTVVSDSGLNWSLGGVWFVPNRKYYIVGDGMFVANSITSQTVSWKNFQPGLTNYYTNAIRGTGLNNIFVVGAFGNTLHFNGMTWSNTQAETYLTSGGFINVDVKGKFMVAVGYVGNRAVALRGYQQ